MSADDFSIHDVERLGRGLHQLGSSLQHASAQLGCRKSCSFPAHHSHARGECAHAAGNSVGLAVDDPDIRVIDTESIGTDLRNDRFHTLADGSDTGDHLHHAIGLHLDAHGVERTEPTLFDEHCHSGSDFLTALAPLAKFLLELVPTCSFEPFIEQELIVTGIVDDLRAERVESEGVGHYALVNEIAFAYCDLVQANFGSDCV